LLAHGPRRVAAALFVCALALAPAALAEEPTVILLSLDGTRADYPERTETPAFDRMEREGARGHVRPVFPSNTFPNHVSLATGTHPDRHGIVSNVFFEPGRGTYRYEADASWIEAEPLWIAAERQGVRSAAYFWVGSETAWKGKQASYRVTPFDEAIPESKKVDQILTWLDLPLAERPRLILSWWHGCDAEGHRRGPNGSHIARQIRAQDAELGRLLEGLDVRRVWDHLTLVVTSDHGMAGVSERIDAAGMLAERGIRSRVIPAGGFAIVWLEDPARAADAIAVFEGAEGIEAYASAALPPELRAYHPRRSGHVFLIATPPRFLISTPSWPVRLHSGVGALFGIHPGMHGYRPDRSDMQAIFYALGRGVGPGMAVGGIANIDVAPTVAAWLGIEPPEQSEGVERTGLLRGLADREKAGTAAKRPYAETARLGFAKPPKRPFP
jgi:predicted AlkP superfamily pyrophosphatase or phosphodiesterase